MYEQIAQIRILLANLNSYLSSLLQENEVLRKEVAELRSKLKEDKKTE